MKKILCLIDSLGPGGAQRQLVGLASFLKEQGYDVSIITYHEKNFYANQLLDSKVDYHCLNQANGTFNRMWRIAQYIRCVKPDTVISYLETPSICACVAKLFNRRFKLIVSERNTTQHTGRNERIRFNLFRIADYVVPNAYSQEAYIRTTFPKLSDKIVTIPNFVDLELFVPPIERSRREFPEIMVAASIWASKNTLGFIDAIARLRQKGYKFHISWYGKSETHLDYFNQCQEKIIHLGLKDFLTLKEKTSDILTHYQSSDFFCLPSFYEGTPNVICEAMACGLPIVCSDVCDNSKYVIEAENGFMFNPHNPDSICQAFEKLLGLDAEAYSNFCNKSRFLAETLLSKDVFIQKYIQLV